MHPDSCVYLWMVVDKSYKGGFSLATQAASMTDDSGQETQRSRLAGPYMFQRKFRVLANFIVLCTSSAAGKCWVVMENWTGSCRFSVTAAWG